MGRIITPVEIVNPLDVTKRVRFDASVDTRYAFMVLPSAWRDKLGVPERVAPMEVEIVDQKTITGQIAGPFAIEIEGFRRVYSEVLFLDMQPKNGEYTPLIGYAVLEAIPVGVDMLGHRLVPLKYADLK